MNICFDKNNTLSLAPFGAVTQALSVLLERQGIRVSHIFDNNKKLHGKQFRSIPISGATAETLSDSSVIVCSFISEKQITKQLKGLSNSASVLPFHKVVDRDDLQAMLDAFDGIKSRGELDNINDYHKNVMFGSGDLSIRAALLPKDITNGVVLPITTFIITEACTLRCVECSNLMQYVTHPKTFDKDKILASFDRLISAVTFLRCVGVSGGEPLLHKGVAEITERIAAYDKVGYIALTTNATVLPKEELIRRISKYDKVIVRISNYGKPSVYVNAIAEMCKKFNVRHAVLENAVWYGGLRITDVNAGGGAVSHIFRACSAKCMCLAEHSFSKCLLALFANRLGAVPDGLPGIPGVLDISRSDFSSDVLRSYLDSNEPFNECSICSGASRTREQVPPGVQAEKRLAYRKYK